MLKQAKLNTSLKDVFKQLNSNQTNVSFLSSNNKNAGWPDILTWNPITSFSYKITAKNHKIEEELKNFIHTQQKNNRIIIGYISYNYGYQKYHHTPQSKDIFQTPDIFFQAYDFWLTKNYIHHKSQDQLNQIQQVLQQPKTKFKKTYKHQNFTPIISRQDYKKSYQQSKQHITQGDIYQLNLTHCLKGETQKPSPKLFLDTISSNPVQYSAYIQAPQFQIISASPERFIKIDNNHIETKPIKGTVPRGKNLIQEIQNLYKLYTNPKEKAELNMITDLLRNDLSIVSKIGSVKVAKKRALKATPSVWHTYSQIQSKKLANISSTEALLQMLPGGSITGCPKLRAFQIIDSLEPISRGIYTGSIGIIYPNDNLEFNIAIRTIIKKANEVYLQVGGGIVHDSKENLEFEETLHKAKSFLQVLQ